jgi:hypothetical protein
VLQLSGGSGRFRPQIGHRYRHSGQLRLAFAAHDSEREEEVERKKRGKSHFSIIMGSVLET